MIPGEVFPADGVIETLPGAPRIELEVSKHDPAGPCNSPVTRWG